MEKTTKIIFWPLNRVVHFVLFFLLWNSLVNLKCMKHSTFLRQNIEIIRISCLTPKEMTTACSASGGDSASYDFAVKMLKWKFLRYRKGFSELVLL